MATRSGPAVLQVHIFRDGEFLGTDVFAERQIVVGRDPDEADLVLESSQVSRRHAIIENDGGKVTVRDAGSTNGVFLNADKVVSPIEVTRLDEIRIGEFALKLKFAGKGKGASEELPAPAESKRAADSTREIQALQKNGAPRAERAPLPNTMPSPVLSAPQPRVEAKPSRMPSASDLSEFDDIPDDPVEDIGRSAPRAEFRKREEPVDREKLGDMLAGIGIAESGVHAPTSVDASPLPMSREPEAKKRSAKGGKAAAFADLASELEGPEAATQTNIAGFPADDLDDETRSDGHLNGNGRTNGARADRGDGGYFPPHANGPISARVDIEPEAIPSGSPVQSRGIPKPPDMLGLDSDPMSPFEPHADVTHDDDHDEDDDYVPQYSLAQHILGEEAPPKQGVPRVEVLAVHDDMVDSVALLAPGESYWIGPPSTIARMMSKAANKEGGTPYKPGPRFELVKHKRPGEVEIEFKKEAPGMVVRGGRSVELGSVQGRQGRKQVRRGTQVMGLARGELAQVTEGATTYHIRLVVAPAPLRDNRPFLQRIRPEKLLMTSAVSALVAHVVIMTIMTFFAGHPPQQRELVQEEFVEVTVEPEMKLEEPPKPPEPPAPEPTPPAPEPKPVPVKNPPKTKAPKVAAAAPAPPNPAPVGVLGLLNKTGATQAPGPAAAVAAISNLAAAKTPSGSSGYKVSGLIGKLPTSELSIGGGGGGPMTKGAAALLRGGGGGAGVISGKATGQVRALVSKVPGGMHAAGGSLDREEIQKVVNKHIGEIQRCYERELLKTPNLAGKVTIEWVVATSGSVKSARQKDSTLQSASAVNCMLASVKGWQFPQPRGGEVVVGYPFQFSALGM